jgi:hypothetical protein
VVIIFITLLGIIPAQGDVLSDLQFITTHNPLDQGRLENTQNVFVGESNEMKIFATGFIRLYQIFLSSQDIPVCRFTPSCSRYGMAAFKKYGLLLGALMTSDRLQRCHGLGAQFYSIHPITGKFYDPIDPNYLENDL